MISGDKTKISERNVRAENEAEANETRNAEGQTFGSRGVRCPFCGTTAETYYKTGLFGCPECYRYLFFAVKKSIYAMQGDEPHAGKTPSDQSARAGAVTAGGGKKNKYASFGKGGA